MFRQIYAVCAVFFLAPGALADEVLDVSLERNASVGYMSFNGNDDKQRRIHISVSEDAASIRSKFSISFKSNGDNEFPRTVRIEGDKHPVYGVLSTGSFDQKLVAHLCRERSCTFHIMDADHDSSFFTAFQEATTFELVVMDPQNDQAAISYAFSLPALEKQAAVSESVKPVAPTNLPKPQSTDPIYAMCNKEHLVRTYFDCACFAAEAPNYRGGIPIDYTQELAQLNDHLISLKKAVSEYLSREGTSRDDKTISVQVRRIADAEARISAINSGEVEKTKFRTDKEIYAEVMLAGTCKNPKAVAADEKKTCLKSSNRMEDDVDPEQYCGCVGQHAASAWAAMASARLDSRILTSLGANARLACR